MGLGAAMTFPATLSLLSNVFTRFTPVHLYVPDISGIKRADRDPGPRP
jgi:hypothetical protein